MDRDEFARTAWASRPYAVSFGDGESSMNATSASWSGQENETRTVYAVNASDGSVAS
jgi:hypothetical protein